MKSAALLAILQMKYLCPSMYTALAYGQLIILETEGVY